MLLDEHFRVGGWRTWFETVEEMKAVLDIYFVHYNTKRPHQGRNMNGLIPAQAFKDGLPKPKSKKGEKPNPKTSRLTRSK